MKRPQLFLLAFMIAAGIFFLPDHSKFDGTSKKSHPGSQREIEQEEGKEKETGAERQLMMWFQSKGYPDASSLDNKYQAAWQEYLAIKKRSQQELNRGTAANWVSLGDVTSIGGRILCIAIDPNNSNNLWAGSASGGIWRSTNAGASWVSVPTNLPVLGVSSILVDPGNSNVIYAGTGEVYRVDTSNTGFNVWKTRGTYGIGILKSTNGGSTWTQVMTKTSNQLFGIQMLEFDPVNSAIIYACATDGLYRSVDNGGTWSQVLSKTYVTDVAINPANTDQVVVSVGNMVNPDKGIYRTTNASSATPTWTKMVSGLPASFSGFIRMDNVGSTRLYASVGGISGGDELYLSTDFGANWFAKTGSGHCSFQYWFAHDLAINPSNTNDILMGGVDFYRYTSTDNTTGGSMATISSSSSPIHSDHHDVEYDPNNSAIIYVACDGGIYKSTDGGVNWNSRNTGLRATQFYASIGVHPTNPDILIGGLQDNGVVSYDGTGWTVEFGGDGGASAIAPNGTTVLASNDARGVRRSTTGAAGAFSSVLSSWAFTADDRTGFMAPVAISKSDGNYMYAATDNIHRTTTGGASGSWTNAPSSSTNYIEQQRKTAIALAVSPTNRNKIYVSTSPIAQNTTNDQLWVNGQPNVFRTTTPSTTPYPSIKGTLPDRFVMDFAISENNDDSVYVVLGGFGTSHVYLTPDGGTTWLSRGAGLPNVPFNAIVIDPVNKGTIYAACDFGVYVSPNKGLTWVDYNAGFWDATLVMDLQISADNKLIAATHGKGVFKSDLYSGGTLPVKLVDFGGVSRNNYNHLYWSVTDEQDMTGYELERSVDGTTYRKIATKTAFNDPGHFTYQHDDPISGGAGEYYYRLKMLENDGSFLYSAVVFIRSSSKTKITVYHNPFRNSIVLRYNIPGYQKISTALYNSPGALLQRQEFNATAGSGIYTLYGFDDLPAGTYFLNTISGDFSQTFKLVKN